MLFSHFRCSRSVIKFSSGYSSATSIRYSSGTAYVLRTPPTSAPREVPTPLIFVYASSWDASSKQGMRRFATMYAERGYTCLELDIASPKETSTSEALMHHFETEVSSYIRLTSIPFPPVIVARGTGALIAQTYISSHSASGLLLISPPRSNEALSFPDSPLLPTPLREFDFEPKFPCAILCTEEEVAEMQKNRLWQDGAVDKLVVSDARALDGQPGFVKIEQWLDEIGV